MTASMIVIQVAAIVGRRYSRNMPVKEAILQAALLVPSHFLIFEALDIYEQHGVSGLGYPTAVSTCLMGFSLYSVVILRERLTLLRAMGLACGFIGVVLATWKAG